jgi:16S rRNA (cytosine1402-N4)-methyltransferase
MNIKANNHIPVLLEPVMTHSSHLNKDSKIFDGTFGGAGYANFFLKLGFQVYACDLDIDAINFYYSANPKQDNLHLVNDNFSSYISTFPDNYFDVIVADLGYSSNQLDFGGRGFSYLKNSEVFDLRYDTSESIPVYEKIRSLKDSTELGRIVYKYSGETFSNKISVNLYNFLKQESGVIFTHQIVEIIENSIPKKFIHKKNAILSRVWQALRVWVNDEFTNLEEFLAISISKLEVEGLLMITSFNSLEDKIVTNFMRKVSKKIETDDFGNWVQNYQILTKKAITPTKNELEGNIRSRSAMLRILKKL